jgi:hypothetical protein
MNTTSEALKALTEDELAGIYAEADETEAAAILAEMSRRDRAARKHARDAARWAAVYAAWHDFAHAQYLAAEAECNGYLLSRDGQAAGIDPFELWSGTEASVRRYASEELRNFWLANARLTVSQFHAQMRRDARAEREAAEGE